jgi:hypothetical protein
MVQSAKDKKGAVDGSGFFRRGGSGSEGRIAEIFVGVIAGGVAAKRKWLSEPIGPRNRVYVSSSNWNSRKENDEKKKSIKQKPTTETLHTVYVSGVRQELTRFPSATIGPNGAPRYVYRQCEVPL